MSNKIRIGIIGGGASGATACKACLEEGFEPVVFEQTDYTGGLWRYHEDDLQGVASVAKSTIINSSKEMSAFSDFPPPKEFPNYMHNSKMVKYFDLYGDKFNFVSHVRFRHRIDKLEPNNDYEKTGKWKITARDLNNDKEVVEVFDGVMVCTGHHTQPVVPRFKDQEKFKGQVVHTHSYKKPDSYDNKKVVVVGIGNSGGDAAVELSSIAEKVYLSTRRGTWVSHRVGDNGRPMDAQRLTRYWNLLFSMVSYDTVCSQLESELNKRFNHTEYQLKPEHRVFAQHVFVNDALPNRILSGTVVVKPDIDRFTENGIVFKGETEETPCDVVLLATGYKVAFPFLSQDIVPTNNNQVDLYKWVFPINLSHPQTLAFISLIQPIGAILPIGEQQSRWFAQLMAGKVTLPDKRTMKKDVEAKRLAMSKRYYQSERHTIQVDWINYMDELAEQYGAKPNLTKYFFTDYELWKALMFGPCLPYQYRLQGPHRWSGAREAILKAEERIVGALQTRPGETSVETSKSNLGRLMQIISVAMMAYLLYNILS